MPNAANDTRPTNILAETFDDAVERLETYLHLPDYPTPRKLSEFELHNYKGRKIVQGWEIKPFNPESGYTLHVLIDNRYPFVAPRVALSPAPPAISYPHIENDGWLCLSASENAISHKDIEAVAESTLIDAVKLVTDSLAGITVKDFHEEILSYWSRRTTTDKKIYSLLDISNKNSRTIWVWRGKVFDLVADTPAQGKSWLQNKFSSKDEYDFEPAAFVWHSKEIMPKDYPTTSLEGYNLIKGCGVDAQRKFDSLSTKFPNRIYIIIGTDTPSGSALLGLILNKPVFKIPAKITAEQHFRRGFRNGFLPADVAGKRYTSSEQECVRCEVKRIDPQWVLSRDANPEMKTINEKTVTVIGCGAVGSEVTRLLVQSGITRLHLVDPDVMNWENIGRHALGAKALNFQSGRPKVDALAEQLKEQYPHIQILSTHSEKWEIAARENNNFLFETDLILMATGEWSADNALNILAQAQENFPPIVYGWTEAFAAAGHSIAVIKDGGCFECAFDNRKFRFQVAEFPKEVFQTAACGSAFQPFNAIDLAPITAMIAKTAMDVLTEDLKTSRIRTWVGSPSIVSKHNGKYTDLLSSLMMAKQSPPFMQEVNLLPVKDCGIKHEEINECDIQDKMESMSR
jgi:molybdopterin/thiamine biosynthesis adenylyltransferase